MFCIFPDSDLCAFLLSIDVHSTGSKFCIKCRNPLVRLSWSSLPLPLLVNGWHGGERSHTNSEFAGRASLKTKSSTFKESMVFLMISVSGKFFEYVAVHFNEISKAFRTFPPQDLCKAAWKPPMPLKNSNATTFLPECRELLFSSCAISRQLVHQVGWHVVAVNKKRNPVSGKHNIPRPTGDLFYLLLLLLLCIV